MIDDKNPHTEHFQGLYSITFWKGNRAGTRNDSDRAILKVQGCHVELEFVWPDQTYAVQKLEWMFEQSKRIGYGSAQADMRKALGL